MTELLPFFVAYTLGIVAIVRFGDWLHTRKLMREQRLRRARRFFPQRFEHSHTRHYW